LRLEKRAVIATRNKKKLKEIKRLLKNKGLTLLSVADLEKKVPKIIEDKKTYRANAIKKARITSRYTDLPVLADDSGLSVDFLKGAPGVHSARFAGASQNDNDNIALLLKKLAGQPKYQRKASFICTVACCQKGKLVGVVEGKRAGYIGFKKQGKTGFGYDPVFIVPSYKKTFAQLGSKVKDKISHRVKAFQKAIKILP